MLQVESLDEPLLKSVIFWGKDLVEVSGQLKTIQGVVIRYS